MNCISASFLHAHCRIFGTPTPSHIIPRTADGTHHAALGKVLAQVLVSHPTNTVTAHSTLQVLRTDDNWTVLLGRPWLQHTSAIINHGTDIVSLPVPDGDPISVRGSIRFQPQMLPIRGVSSDQFTGPTQQALLDAIHIGPDLTPSQTSVVQQIIISHSSAFAQTLSQVQECPHTEHTLNIDPKARLHKVAFGRPLTEPELRAATDSTNALLAAGIIERVRPEQVKCVAPTVMAKKKGPAGTISIQTLQYMANEALAASQLPPMHPQQPGQPPPIPDAPTNTPPTLFRMCHNFSAINKATQVKAFPPGDLDAKVKRHAGKRWIIQLDALGAFYWIPVTPESRPYLCFFIQGSGYFQYRRLPMGATGSPGTYQVAFQRTFGPLLDPGPVSAWMDDLFASGDDFDDLCLTLKAILGAAIASNLRFCPAKTRLFVSTATLGGSSVSQEGVTPDLDKVAAILQWPRPANAREVLSFVNTAAVYRSYIRHFADIARPLYDLTKGIRAQGKGHGSLKLGLSNTDVRSLWLPAHETAFTTLKTCLTSFPICVGPIWDRPFVVTCDASAQGFGGHLAQRDNNGKLRTIAWASYSTTPAESTLHSSSLELAACKWVLDKFERFTYGQPIILRTDCQAVRDMLRSDTSPGGYKAPWKEAILARRIIALEHTPGSANVVADSLSRLPGMEHNTTPVSSAWETGTGVVNDLYEVPLRRLSSDEQGILLQRFEGDILEDTVRVLCDDPTLADFVALQQVARQFSVINGQLSRRINGKFVTVLPAVEGIFVARDCHVAGGHFGRDLTIANLNRSVTWPGMRRSVDDVISSCPKCSLFGPRMQKLLLQPIIRFYPFQTVAMDYLTMPPVKGGLDTILVAIDLFSKFVLTYAFRGPATAVHTLHMLDDIATNFVTPDEILTDNGTHFRNARVAQWCQSNSTRQTFSAPYAHVGSVENANRLVLERLRRICNVHSGIVPPTLTPATTTTNWSSSLHLATKAINDRKLSFLAGFSPREVLFGLNSTRPWSGERGDLNIRMVQLDDNRLDVALAYIDEQDLRTQASSKQQWNTFQPSIGDIVQVNELLRDSHLAKDKLRPRWTGPYRVVDTRRRSVRVANLSGLPREGWISWYRLRIWRQPPNVPHP